MTTAEPTRPVFRNETNRAVFDELDSLLGKVASVHTLSTRLGLSESKVRSTLSRLSQRGLVNRVDGTPSVWEVTPAELTEPTTYTHVIIGPGFWGAGNSLDEARANAPAWSRAAGHGFDHLEFNGPIFDIEVNSVGGLTWTWAGDRIGKYTVTMVPAVASD